MVKRRTWLSITPEPERELPQLVATLRAGASPDPRAVTVERGRVEQLVLRGSERDWLAYLHDVVELIEHGPAGPESELVTAARRRAIAVVANHHNLLLALPGRAAARTAADRTRLAARSTE